MDKLSNKNISIFNEINEAIKKQKEKIIMSKFQYIPHGSRCLVARAIPREKPEHIGRIVKPQEYLKNKNAGEAICGQILEVGDGITKFKRGDWIFFVAGIATSQRSGLINYWGHEYENYEELVDVTGDQIIASVEWEEGTEPTIITKTQQEEDARIISEASKGYDYFKPGERR